MSSEVPTFIILKIILFQSHTQWNISAPTHLRSKLTHSLWVIVWPCHHVARFDSTLKSDISGLMADFKEPGCTSSQWTLSNQLFRCGQHPPGLFIKFLANCVQAYFFLHQFSPWNARWYKKATKKLFSIKITYLTISLISDSWDLYFLAPHFDAWFLHSCNILLGGQ